ncbi:pEARLI1-like lipid transfer protein 1 [Glycine soja]
MASNMCVFVALNVVVFFAVVSGCDKCSAVTNTSVDTTVVITATTTLSSDVGCPRNVLKLDLYGLEVAVCLCTALKANIMGINLVTSTPSLNATTGCPRDVLKLGVCSGILNGWMNFSMGLPLKTHCCSAIEGLYDFEVALCVCTALKANIMGINLDIPISFTKLINTCDKKVPNGFICD